MTHHQHADYDRHTDEELREAVDTADREYPRVKEASSEEAAQANRRQREAMAEELDEREGA